MPEHPVIDEGYIKFQSHWERTAAIDIGFADDLLNCRQQLYEQKLLGYDEVAKVGYGNISVRNADDSGFVISGTQTGHLSEVDGAHFAEVYKWNTSQNTVHSRGATEASSESLTHAALYDIDASTGAVVHVHDAKLWHQYCGILPTTAEDTPYGTPEMADAFARLFKDTSFGKEGLAVMAGHADGLVAIAANIHLATQKILSLKAKSQ